MVCSVLGRLWSRSDSHSISSCSSSWLSGFSLVAVSCCSESLSNDMLVGLRHSLTSRLCAILAARASGERILPRLPRSCHSLSITFWAISSAVSGAAPILMQIPWAVCRSVGEIRANSFSSMLVVSLSAIKTIGRAYVQFDLTFFMMEASIPQNLLGCFTDIA